MTFKNFPKEIRRIRDVPKRHADYSLFNKNLGFALSVVKSVTKETLVKYFACDHFWGRPVGFTSICIRFLRFQKGKVILLIYTKS